MAPVLHFFDFFQTCGPADLLTRPHLYKLVTCPTLRIFFQWNFFDFLQFRPFFDPLVATYALFLIFPRHLNQSASQWVIWTSSLVAFIEHRTISQWRKPHSHTFSPVSLPKKPAASSIYGIFTRNTKIERKFLKISAAHTQKNVNDDDRCCVICV